MFTKNYYIGHVSSSTAADDYNLSTIDKRYVLLRDINGNLLKSRDNYGQIAGGATTIALDVGESIIAQLKLAKSDLKCDKTSVSTKSSARGVCFGNGTAPATINDYNMSGDLFTTYKSSYSHTITYDDTGVSNTVIYTLTNTGTEDFTISEIGLFGYAYIKNSSSSFYYNNSILVERTLLETPITIPGNNGVGQITYTLRYDFPTE